MLELNGMISQVNDILYKHDPVGTCCNVIEDMENEYWSTSDLIVERYYETQELSEDTIRDAIIEVFGVDESEINWDNYIAACDEIIILTV